MADPRPLAVTLGDPAGIGPEIVAGAFAQRHKAQLPPFVAIGSVALLREAARTRSLDIEVTELDDRGWDAIWPDALPVVDGFADYPYAPGQTDEEGARIALVALEFAIAHGLAGEMGQVDGTRRRGVGNLPARHLKCHGIILVKGSQGNLRDTHDTARG